MQRQAGRASLFDGLAATVIFLLIYFIIATLLTYIVSSAYTYRHIGKDNYNFLSEVATVLPLSIAVLVYMLLYKGTSLPKTLRDLGFVSNGISGKIGIGIMLFMVIFMLELLATLVSSAINIPINTNTNLVFAGAPAWFFIFIALVEPINEEIMFRGFLVPRIGILPSALLFGLAHYSYMSTFGIEVIAAFIFGALAGYIFRSTKSIYPGIVAHILVNTLAVIGMLAIG